MKVKTHITSFDLWPTRVAIFEAPVNWVVSKQLADAAITAAGVTDNTEMLTAAKRRVRGILDEGEAGHALKSHLCLRSQNAWPLGTVP